MTIPKNQHNTIVGREIEQARLHKIVTSREAEFLAIYGRRRIGKTFLIEEYFKSADIYFTLTGIKDGSLADQLGNFTKAFNRLFRENYLLSTPKNWLDALHQLVSAIEKTPTRGKIVIFFDELPWLASKKSKFLQALEYLWNTWASKRNDIILIVCGSAASWMINKILHHKGGLYNRITARMRLLPFTLKETEKFLNYRKIHLDRQQVLELYMALGGIPHYLKQVEKGWSAAQNINQLAFSKEGLLHDEFDKLYAALFDHPNEHINIVKTLAMQRTGLTREALRTLLKITSGGGLTKQLKELEESGFIAGTIPFGKKRKNIVYRLIDEYSLFYLDWIAKAPQAIFTATSHQYWLQKRSSPRWKAWAGYSFEGICLKHIEAIKMALGINGVSTVESGWFYRPQHTSENGAQIDLVIDRSDHCINLCEIKYTDTPFTITKSYAENLRNKRDIFKAKTKTFKTIFVTFIAAHGVQINAYYEEIVSNQITLDALF